MAEQGFESCLSNSEIHSFPFTVRFYRDVNRCEVCGRALHALSRKAVQGAAQGRWAALPGTGRGGVRFWRLRGRETSELRLLTELVF